MDKFIFIEIFIYIVILYLSFFIISISKIGVLGLRFKEFCSSNSFFESIILYFIIFSFFMLFKNILYFFIDYLYNNLSFLSLNFKEAFIDNGSDANNGQDPIRWWPNLTVQAWTTVGSTLAVFRLIPGSHKSKILGAIGSIIVTVPMVVFSYAVENPNGFNKIMFTWCEFRRTGKWPINVGTVSDSDIDNEISNCEEEAINVYKSSFSDLTKNSLFFLLTITVCLIIFL